MTASSLISQFGLAWSAYILATASPGPGVMAIIGTSTEAGRKAGVFFALGVLSGSLTWALLTLAGVSTLIQAHPQGLMLVKGFGGTYLLWMGWGALGRALKGSDGKAPGPPAAQDGSFRYYLRGYGVHLTNPKAVMAWLMLASLALPADAGLGHAVIFVSGCLVLGSMIFLSYALVFSIPSVMAGYRRFSRPIEAVMAVLFAYAGITLLLGVL